MKTEIRIRAFRATDDPETCEKFIEGHRKVLEHHGISKVTSANEAWAESSSVFVVVVEDMERKKLYGGARLHAADGKMLLPIEEATKDLDERILDYVRRYAEDGTGEICGLWNSVEVAGLGIGSLYPSRGAVVIATQLGLNTLFSLCSPVTARFNQRLGSKTFKEVGNEGTFYYPKLDLIATAVFLDDALALRNACPHEREKMMQLRESPRITVTEKAPFKDVTVDVHYDLLIKSANPLEFKLQNVLYYE
jgi:hypothetical protein